MSFSQSSGLNPAGMEFHQVSTERWKEFSDAVEHLDQSFQELLRNMSENQKKKKVLVSPCKSDEHILESVNQEAPKVNL